MTVVLLAGLQVREVLLALLRLAPHPPIEDAHDRHGRIERRYCRAERDVIVRLDELDEAFICNDTMFFRLTLVRQLNASMPLVHEMFRASRIHCCTCSDKYMI